MANKLEYIFSLQDKMSAKLGRINATTEKTMTVLSGVKEKTAGVEAVFKDTGRTIGALKMKIDALQAEKEWIPAENLSAAREYNKEIPRLTKEVNALEAAGSGGKFKKWASDAFNAIPGAGLLKNPLVAGVTALGLAGKAGMDFDEGMAKVNITAQLDEAGLSDLKDKLKKIANDNKTDVTLSPAGFEQINSQLNDVDLSLSILDASLKGSKAGFTDVTTVSSALAQSLSIIGKENASAQEVLDTFFAAKRVGAGEFADFARYMPNLIAGASNMGIAYKEVAGTFAYMTGKGQSAERAAVLMENAFSVLGRGGVQDNLAKAGVNVFDEAGKIRSLVDVFGELQGVMDGMNDEQKSSFLEKVGLVDKEAKNAFAILTSDIDKYNSSMQDVTNSSGETDTALGFSKNSVQQATEVWGKFKTMAGTIGETILPVISAGLSVADIALSAVSFTLDTVVGFFGSWYSLLSEGNPLVVGLTSALGLFTIAMGANYAITQKAVIIGGIKKVLDIAQAAATWGLTTAQWALNAAFYASPLGWIALAIGAVIAAVTYCWQKFEGFRVVVMGVWGTMKEFGRVLIESVVSPFKQVINGIGGVCSAIVDLVKGNFKEAAAAAKQGLKDIGSGVLKANPIAIGVDVAQKGNWEDAWEKGKQDGRDSWKASQEKTDDLSAADKLIPAIPVPANNPPVDVNALMAKLGGNKKEGKKGTAFQPDSVSFQQDGIDRDLKETVDYTAATKKMEAIQLSLKPVVPEVADKVPGKIIDGKTAFTGVNDKEQNYEPKKADLLLDIMHNVRKIAAAVAIPLAFTVSTPNEAQARDVQTINVPEVQIPAMQAPAMQAPAMQAVQVPAMQAPAIRVPAMQAPAVSVPEIASPAVTVPDVNVPDVAVNNPAIQIPEMPTMPAMPAIPEMPAVQVPAMQAPAMPVMQAPAVSVPEIASPAVTVPDVNVPNVAVNNPAIQIPEMPAIPAMQVPAMPTMQAPAVSVPEIASPAVTVPDVNVPDVAVNNPAIQIPAMPAMPAVQVPAMPTMQAPAVSVPEIASPAVTVPDVNVPDVAVNNPAIQIPAMPAMPAMPAIPEMPAVQVPAMQVPAIQAPAVSVPEIASPAVTVPDVNVPNVAVNNPAIQIPEMPAMPAMPAIPAMPAMPAVQVPAMQVPAMPTMQAPAVSVPEIDIPTPSSAYDKPVSSREEKETIKESMTVKEGGKTVYVDRICESIVIHVQNTNGADADTIREEIINILNQVAE